MLSTENLLEPKIISTVDNKKIQLAFDYILQCNNQIWPIYHRFRKVNYRKSSLKVTLGRLQIQRVHMSSPVLRIKYIRSKQYLFGLG